MLHVLNRVLLTSVLSLVIVPYVFASEKSAQVARAVFSNDVIDREPVDRIGDTVEVDYSGIQKVYFFTDLRGMDGNKVIHRWLFDGEVMADIPFDIGGDRWRVWSSKRLLPGFEGTWTAQVVEGDKVLASKSFQYEGDSIESDVGDIVSDDGLSTPY